MVRVVGVVRVRVILSEILKWQSAVPEGYLPVPKGYLLVPEGYLYKG